LDKSLLNMKVADLTTDELKTLIRETDAESLEELLGDPDEGLEIHEDLRAQLLSQDNEIARGERGEALGNVLHSLGL